MNLKTFQQQFQLFILKNKSDIEKNILPTEKLSSSEQMNIYQNSYFERIIAAMTQDFPILESYLGENAFSSLVRDYIHHHPSNNINLRLIGKNLSQFLLEKDSEFLPFSELARLEYAMTQVTSGEKIEFESDFNVVEVYQTFYYENKLIEIIVL